MNEHANFSDRDIPAHQVNPSVRDLLTHKSLILVSNRGPVTLRRNEPGDVEFQRGSGGLVTALAGLIQQTEACWIACARTQEDVELGKGLVPLGFGGDKVWMRFITPSPEAYNSYYHVIANPLLWFLQHSMWNIFREPTIDQQVWEHWENGYVAVNEMFANAISQEISSAPKPALVMLQDYHLYLTPGMIRNTFRPKRRYTLAHFVHIPWPGSEDWGFLPPRMREAILEGLCAVDLLGFQTREDGLNFIRTCESHLPGAQVNFRKGRVRFRNHTTHVRDFPISIDVQGLRTFVKTEEVRSFREQLTEWHGEYQIILRIDRIEPSKNIVRGFQAFEDMLERHAEHRGKVKFLALLVPSRLGLSEYGDYLSEVMGLAGKVNAKYGGNGWEPIRVIVEENYPRAIAGLQIYDVLLANSIADGMNLIVKEGPTVNCQNGVVILSERTGAFQQLEPGVLVVAPLDVYGTAESLHQALTMPAEERQERAERLRSIIEQHDIIDWLQEQLNAIKQLNL